MRLHRVKTLVKPRPLKDPTWPGHLEGARMSRFSESKVGYYECRTLCSTLGFMYGQEDVRGNHEWRIRVNEELDSKARLYARDFGRPLSQLVRDAVEEYLRRSQPAGRPAQAQSRQFSMVSLFSGAGGLDAGLHKTGKFRLLAAVELEDTFCKTLTLNQANGLLGNEHTKIIQADLASYSPQDLMSNLGIKPGELDVLVGGPPCQSWSTAGRRAGVGDPRGQLIWDFLRFVEALQPKVFLMENVRGLFSSGIRHRPIAERPSNGGAPLAPEELPGSAFQLWVSDALKMHSGSYRVDSFEVNAANYGGPQIRERVLVFGNRLNRRAPAPQPSHSQVDENLPCFKTLRQALDGLVENDPVLVDFSPRKKKYLDYVPMGGNWRSMPDHIARESMGKAYFAKGGRSGWWRRLSWDLPSPTITTLPNHSSTSLCHPEQTRVLSVGECARIQEFPDGWTFAGKPADQMKQVGNAVPVRLGEVSGAVISQLLTDSSLNVDDSELPRYTNTYLNSHVRTRRWWKDGKAVVIS